MKTKKQKTVKQAPARTQPERPAPPWDRVDELWGEVGHLAQFVIARFDRGHPVRKAFVMALEDVPHQGRPKLANLQAARDAFYALPEVEQRRLMNDWQPCPVRPSIAELHGHYDLTVARYLELAASRESAKAAVSVAADEEFELNGLTAPVLVRIRECTPREDAIAMLEAAMEKLRRDWAWMVGNLDRTKPPVGPRPDRG